MMKFNPVSLDWKKYVLKIFFSEYYQKDKSILQLRFIIIVEINKKF